MSKGRERKTARKQVENKKEINKESRTDNHENSKKRKWKNEESTK